MGYNGGMKKASLIFLLLTSLLLTAFTSKSAIQPQFPSALDLIAAVNALRASYGLDPLQSNGSLMAAAQNQAQYLASLGGPNITNGHQSADGSYALDRARAAGYPMEAGVDVVECWAWTRTGVSLETIISSIWGDQSHMDVMLHKYGKDVGASIIEQDNMVYYILDVGTLWGSSSANSSTTGTPVISTIKPTANKTPQVVPVEVSTPKPDGSISHLVQSGQALWSIAIQYGVTVKQLQTLNNLSENAPIYVGETLVIRAANTPTVTPTITPTPRVPTRTPVPPQPVGTNIPTSTTPNSSLAEAGLDRTTIGLILILVCGVGLVLIILGVLRREKK